MSSLYDCNLLSSLGTSELSLNNETIFDLQHEIDGLKREMNNQLLFIGLLQKRNQILETRMAEKDGEFDTIRKKLHTTQELFYEQIQVINDEKKAIIDHNENMLNLKEQEIMGLKNKHDQQIMDLKKKHDQQIMDLKKKHDQQIMDLEMDNQIKMAVRANEMKLAYEFLMQKKIGLGELEKVEVPLFKRFCRQLQKQSMQSHPGSV